MKYTQFSVTNFRGITPKPLVINADSRVVTLLGLNESGKTTILEAISLLGEPEIPTESLYGAGSGETDKTDYIPLGRRANFTDEIKVCAVVALAREDVEGICQVAKERHNLSLDQDLLAKPFQLCQVMSFTDSEHKASMTTWGIGLRGTFGRQTKAREIYSENREVWSDLVDVARSRLPAILYFPTFLFDFPETIILNPLESDREDNRNRHYRQVVQDILDALPDKLAVGKHIVDRALDGSPNARRSLETVLNKVGREVSRTVFDRWDSVFDRKAQRKDIRVRCDTVPRPGGDAQVHLSFEMVDGNAVYRIAERSLGFRWFFSFLLFTQYRVFRSGEDNVLFLFDEPASNLHPRAQQQLLSSFDRVTAGGARIIYSTHSHHMINPRWLESCYIVRNLNLDYDVEVVDDRYAARDTEIVVERYRTFAGQNPQKTTYFQPILDALDYAPSNIEFVQRAVFVEGKNDFYAIRAVLPNSRLAVIPGIGASGLASIVSLYLGWGKEFVIMLDGDEEGVRSKERYMREWLLSSSQVATLADVDSAWAGWRMEDLFQKHDKEALRACYNASQGGPLSKKQLCRAIQEGVAAGVPFNWTSSTISRFERLESFLQGMLDSAGRGELVAFQQADPMDVSKGGG